MDTNHIPGMADRLRCCQLRWMVSVVNWWRSSVTSLSHWPSTSVYNMVDVRHRVARVCQRQRRLFRITWQIFSQIRTARHHGDCIVTIDYCDVTSPYVYACVWTLQPYAVRWLWWPIRLPLNWTGGRVPRMDTEPDTDSRGWQTVCSSSLPSACVLTT